MALRVVTTEPKRTWWRLVSVLAVAGLATAGCGSGGDSAVRASDSDGDSATSDEFDESDDGPLSRGDRDDEAGSKFSDDDDNADRDEDGDDGDDTRPDRAGSGATDERASAPASGDSSRRRSGATPGRSDDTGTTGRSDPRRSDREPDRGPGDRGDDSDRVDDDDDSTVAILTSRQICSRVSATGVSEATGLDIVGTTPAPTTKTPQCRYRFAGADNLITNATVAALRPDEDMGGRSGREAYRHAVEVNRGAAASSGVDVTETSLDVGDESILFENDLLRYGIIRYGERIVTVILNAPSADHSAAVALASATAPLAVP